MHFFPWRKLFIILVTHIVATESFVYNILHLDPWVGVLPLLPQLFNIYRLLGFASPYPASDVVRYSLLFIATTISYNSSMYYSPVSNRNADTKAWFGLKGWKVENYFIHIFKTYSTRTIILINWTPVTVPMFKQIIQNFYIYVRRSKKSNEMSENEFSCKMHEC